MAVLGAQSGCHSASGYQRSSGCLAPLLVLGICLSLENDLVPAPFEVWCQSSNTLLADLQPSILPGFSVCFSCFSDCLTPDPITKGVHTQESPLYPGREQTSHLTNRRGRIGGDTCVGTKIVSQLFLSIQEDQGAGSASKLTVPSQVLVKSGTKTCVPHFLCSAHRNLRCGKSGWMMFPTE